MQLERKFHEWLREHYWSAFYSLFHSLYFHSFIFLREIDNLFLNVRMGSFRSF
jgi:hypothetical protein